VLEDMDKSRELRALTKKWHNSGRSRTFKDLLRSKRTDTTLDLSQNRQRMLEKEEENSTSKDMGSLLYQP
jgi:hypothetical protein